MSEFFKRALALTIFSLAMTGCVQTSKPLTRSQLERMISDLEQAEKREPYGTAQGLVFK